MVSRLRGHPVHWYDLLLVGGLSASVAILLIGLLSWQSPFGSQIQLAAGQVAPYDIVAPRQIGYESAVQTERARERAAQGVPDQYDSPDSRVRRHQIERARQILDYVTIVRSDAYAAPEVQTDYLLAVADLNLTPESTQQILDLSDEEWEAAAGEIPLTLDRAMREEIRESNISTARRRVPSQVMAELSEPAVAVTVELVRALIRPNSVLNQARTDELRDKARSDVPAQMVNLERNEIIVRAGDITTVDDVEALTQIGLIHDEWNWWVTARSFLFVLALLAVVGSVLYRLRPRTIRSLQDYSLLVVMVVAWLLAAKFLIVPHDWLPYLYPLAALGMLAAVLLDLRVAVVVVLAFGLVANYMAPNNAPLVAYLTLGSLVGALILGRAERLTAFLWAGLAIALTNWIVMSAFRAPYDDVMPARLMQLHVVIFLNGGLSASMAMIGYLVLGNLFGVTTSLQLTELSRPTHPLLRQLLLKASGTYHHTIVVSNLAERAAAAIGADAFLTRVGAYYHDIGKTVRPYFFTENIVDDNSPHDKLDPLTSAQIIISHVSDGIDLANKYHLPARIQDFIREHHGRTLVKYFYSQAQHEAGDDEVVDETDFRYPGPSPRSKETAILFLADTCEAAVRAVRPATREELEALVNRLIDERVAEGEMNDCNLTFRELQVIKEVFLQVLQGVHHPRIQYPEQIVRKAKPSAPALSAGEGGARVPVPGGVEEPAGV